MTEPHAPLVFPSEVSSRSTGNLRLAGRLAAIDKDAVRVSDAFAAVRLRGSLEAHTGSSPDARARGPQGAAVGDWAVLSVIASSGELSLLGLLELHRADPAYRNEQARFVDEHIGFNLRSRAHALSLVRSFFAGRAFVEVDTPLLVPSPGLDLHLDAVETTGGYLITSPEYQMKRLIVGGLPRLYQVSHVFRQGELGARHNPEFTMLEWYRAFADMGEVMRDTEDLVVSLYESLGEARQRETHVEVRPPFDRMSVCEAFARFANVAESAFFEMAARDHDAYFRILVEQVEPALAAWPRPIFLVDYPISQASLARANPDDPRVSERFELYVDGVELCNGFGELTDPVEQRRRLLEDQRARAALGKPVYPVDERFVAALHEGMPPSAGNALGLDRLIAFCLGESEIARVMAFPAGIV
jgi:lysyl-tRNA synthetase class 2